MSDSPRPKLKLKSNAPARDPRRPTVRSGAPRPPAPPGSPSHPAPASSPRRTERPAPPTSARPPTGRSARPAPQPAQPARAAERQVPRPSAAPAVAKPSPEGVRLSKVMSDRGLASRREADEWIEAGWVRVDGQVAVLGQRVRPEQQIEVDPAAREHQARRVTILLHKPVGYVSGQAEDGYEPARVLVTPENRWSDDTSRIPFHRGHLAHLVPAGRLDIDSTGLLVLTQDGRIARHLIGEDSLVEKEYLVRVEPIHDGSVHPEALRLLSHGLELDGQPLKPAKVSWQNEEQLRVVLREGKKRQIRRMCEAVGFKVLALKRVRIGSVVLGKLPLGQWRYLGPHERF